MTDEKKLWTACKFAENIQHNDKCDLSIAAYKAGKYYGYSVAEIIDGIEHFKQKYIKSKSDRFLNEGFFVIGDTQQCKKCKEYTVELWSNYQTIKTLCYNCTTTYFISASEKRNSTRLHKWSLAVREKDNFMCRICGSKEKLNAHHIKPYAIFPKLRFDIKNGITLCEDCHKKIHKENEK